MTPTSAPRTTVTEHRDADGIDTEQVLDTERPSTRQPVKINDISDK
ncbi:hypothetical protein [Frankia sp. Cr2]|nr:hypothetical protein [Frankia sp. Cr2]